jgi:hypothetical protein
MPRNHLVTTYHLIAGLINNPAYFWFNYKHNGLTCNEICHLGLGHHLVEMVLFYMEEI